MTRAAPLLSVILVTPDSFETLRRVVRHLRAQDGRDRIELLIVAPTEAGLKADPAALDGFYDVRVVPIGPLHSAGHATAAGVRAARGAIVVYVEEHSFPAAGWAEALIRAHEGPWAAIGPGMANANPATRVSWTSLFLDFGPWVLPASSGPATILPSHQTSYKRDVLTAYGEALGDFLETETTLQRDLGAKGHELYFESAARTDHVNVSRIRDLGAIQYQNYRAFAANRVRDGRWSRWRRGAYVLGAPLIPLVRGARVVREMWRRPDARRLLPGCLPSMLVGLAAGATGEFVGFTIGAGDAARRRLSFELDRLEYVTASDRRRIVSGEGE